MTKGKHEKSCGAVTIRHTEGQPEFLVVRQTAGHWGFPKGHVEEGENEHETAMREVLEETGIEITILEGFRESTRYSPKPGVTKDVIYFIAKPIGGTEHRQEEEISEICWVSAMDVQALLTYENDINLFRKAMKYLKANDDEYND